MTSRGFELGGLDGTNPLGFLAALGTLVVAARGGASGARLRWKRGYRWVPVLDGLAHADEVALCGALAGTLREHSVSEADAKRLTEAQKAMETLGTALKKKREDLRRRKLRGAEREEAIEREVRPLEAELERARERWIEARTRAVPRPELALGKRIEDATGEEYRDLARRLLAEGVPPREVLDLLAALWSDACVDDGGRLEPTPFEFTKGSGHQSFLEDVRKLIGQVAPERIQETLFQPWRYRDPGLSLRWDPAEDRRYALLDRNPSADGARTVWMANLLAYHALALFPASPCVGGLSVPGWREDGDRLTFSWPLWEHPADLDTVRSLLAMAELTLPRPDAASLRARGIAAVYRAERIEVGDGTNRKINFAQARAIC